MSLLDALFEELSRIAPQYWALRREAESTKAEQALVSERIRVLKELLPLYGALPTEDAEQ